MLLSFLFVLTFANSPIPLLNQADVLREAGESVKALDLYNQVLVDAVEKKDDQALVGALTGSILSWKHLYYKTQDRSFAILVKMESNALSQISEEKKLPNKHLIYFLTAQADNLLQDYPAAEKNFQLALENYPSDDAQKGDWTAHLGEALYLVGKKEEGKKTMLQGIKKIQTEAEGVDPFLIHVWTSGAYLRLAKLLKQDEPEESQYYLNEARKIIASDPKLVIRKHQIDSF